MNILASINLINEGKMIQVIIENDKENNYEIMKRRIEM